MMSFYRKALVICSWNWVAISNGFTFGHLTGMMRALQKQDEGIVLSENEIFLMSAFPTLAAGTGIVLLAFVGDKIGRRWSFILFSIPMVINWIILYHARDMATFMISRFFAGLSIGGTSTLNLVVAAEFTSPKSRGIYLSMVSMISPGLGNGLGHILGVVIHWRTLVLFGAIWSAVHVVLPYFWVESPQWLASRGKFEDCEKAYRKLNGKKDSAEHELRLLIKMEMSKQKASKETNTGRNIKKLFLAFRRRYFWDLMIMSFFIYLYYAAAGKMIFASLATVILEEMTGTSDVLQFTLLVDGFILIGTCLSCVLIKKMSIRVLLFSSGLTANVILIVLSACLYFKSSEAYFQWINVTLLACYFIISHAGPYPVIEILSGEMFPLELKLYCFLLITPIMLGTVFVSIVLLPSILSAMGYHGLFLLNSAFMFVCLGYLWWRLPETKGKTLQEIEVYFKTNNFDVDEVLNNEQMKAFV